MSTEQQEQPLPAGSAPIVPLPRAGVSAMGIAAGGAIAAALLFVALESRRQQAGESGGTRAPATSNIESPPPLSIPELAPVREAPPVATVQPVPARGAAQSYRPAPTFGYASPTPTPSTYAAPPPPVPLSVASPSRGDDKGSALVLDTGSAESALPTSTTPNAAGGQSDTAGDDQAARATLIRNRSGLVPQGTLIPAVLETPIDSSRAGLARALVARDVRGFDGSRVLIPRGSRLIGEAKGDIQAGQSRVLVTWTRLIRPDGVAIRIGSPGADNLGGAGLRGQVNNFFFERFANAVLQSALQIGINRASRPRDGVFVGIPGQVGGAVGQTPLFNVPAGPTVKVRQGAEIAIFVARDLDFGGIGAR